MALKNTTLAVAACLALTACPTLQDRQEAIDHVAAIQARIEVLEDRPPSPERDQQLSNALLELRQAQKAAEAVVQLTGPERVARTGQIATDAATGNSPGVILGIFTALGALSTWWTTKASKKAKQEAQRYADARVAQESAKRDESRALQGIAGASERSVRQAESPVALATKTVTAPGGLTAQTLSPADRSWEPRRATEAGS